MLYIKSRFTYLLTNVDRSERSRSRPKSQSLTVHFILFDFLPVIDFVIRTKYRLVIMTMAN